MLKDSKDKRMTECVRTQVDRLAAVVLKNMIQQNPGKNIIFSPLSVYILLSMAADATAGQTKEEICRLLCEGEYSDEIIKQLPALLKSLTAGDSYSLANAVVVREDIHHSIVPGYEKHLEEVFDGKLFMTDNMVDHVNAWVRKNTRGMIPSMMDESMKDVLLCMLSACAFLADWKNQYEERDIQNEDFHNLDKTLSRVKMLLSYEPVYIEDESFTGFAKPYKNEEYSYVVLLPKDEDRPLEGCIGKLDFSRLITGVENTYANVLMPEFKCSTDVDMSDMMKKLGVHTVFTPQADFSPISSEWLKADAIRHKAYIEVDRKGTKAAAVTSMFGMVGAAPVEFPEEKDVFVTRPFFYAVVHHATGIPVFLGAVTHLDPLEGENLLTNKEKEEICGPIFNKIIRCIFDEEGSLKEGFDRSLWKTVNIAKERLDIDELKRIETQVCKKR